MLNGTNTRWSESWCKWLCCLGALFDRQLLLSTQALVLGSDIWTVFSLRPKGCLQVPIEAFRQPTSPIHRLDTRFQRQLSADPCMVKILRRAYVHQTGGNRPS